MEDWSFIDIFEDEDLRSTEGDPSNYGDND